MGPVVTTEHQVSLSRLFGWAVLALLVISFVVGAAVLPLRQPDGHFSSWWEAFRRALGVPHHEQTRVQVPSSTIAKTFIWSSELKRRVERADRQNGGDLYEMCLPCHSSENLADDPKVPLIDSMSARVMLKQLHDYAMGVREGELMQPIAQGLNEHDAIDLAAFIAAMPRPDPPVGNTTVSVGDPSNPTYRLIYFGDPRRGIAPCSSCHGPDGVTADAPQLYGLSREYFQKQIDDFANGARANDLYSAMRMISRQLTVSEQSELAQYFAGWDDLENR